MQENNTLTIDNDYILARISSIIGSDLLDNVMNYDILTMVVNKDCIPKLLAELKNDEELRFDFLTDLCGIHYPHQKGNELGVVYHLHSFNHNIRLRFKTFTSIDTPSIPSATGVYESANWMERETFDFYGILFTGHPDLRRILNMDEMDYFPLRKEYPLQDATRTDKEDKYFGRQ